MTLVVLTFSRRPRAVFTTGRRKLPFSPQHQETLP
jgi:hypothetical protein